MRIAYFTNAYPAVSHTFIRREIRAIETLGVTILRYALRSTEIFDPDDIKEKEQTRYILSGTFEFFRRFVVIVLNRPLGVGRAILQAIKMGWHSDRGLLRHFAYLAEAGVLAYWCHRDGTQHIHAHFGTNSAAIA